jgi:Glyoxalase-like domain
MPSPPLPRISRTILGLLLCLIPGTLRSQERPACAAGSSAPRLDHVILVVRDLDSAWARFAPLGFRFKPGRLHSDSLLNRHIKFRDHTELELMSLAGAPTSRMARDYADLLATGEKGVYAALWTDEMDTVRARARSLALPMRSTRLGAWEFLSFPGLPDAAAIFFGSGGMPAVDPDSVLAHPNGVVGLDAAWVEAGPRLERLLRKLGSVPCGTVAIPDGRTGVRWALAAGSLVLVPPEHGTAVPRVLGVELRRSGSHDGSPGSLIEPLQGFWLVFR